MSQDQKKPSGSETAEAGPLTEPEDQLEEEAIVSTEPAPAAVGDEVASAAPDTEPKIPIGDPPSDVA